MESPNDNVVIDRPNRDKASSKTTKAVVVLLLLVSAALMLIVTIGGWDVLQGALPVQIGYIVVYLIMAYFIARWKRGLLPVAGALAIILAIFAAVAAPEWFDRDTAGFEQPALDAGVLGLITTLIIPVQILLLASAMVGFQQAWNVEVERRTDHPSPARTSPQPA
jgi:hypothetical protein